MGGSEGAKHGRSGSSPLVKVSVPKVDTTRIPTYVAV